MIFRNKPRVIAVLAILGLAFMISYYEYYRGLTYEEPPSGTLIDEIPSPNGQWLLRLYKSDYGGAVGGTMYRGAVAPTASPSEERTLYYDEPEGFGPGSIAWRDSSTVIVEGREIDVREGRYDFRYRVSPVVRSVLVGGVTLAIAGTVMLLWWLGARLSKGKTSD